MITTAFIASIPGFVALSDALRPSIAGILLVLVALAGILGLARLRRRSARVPVPAAPAPAPAVLPAATPPPSNAAAAELLAVIASAVHFTLRGAPHRIHAITAAEGPLEWAREGRRNIFASHQPH